VTIVKTVVLKKRVTLSARSVRDLDAALDALEDRMDHAVAKQRVMANVEEGMSTIAHVVESWPTEAHGTR
jgi:hypothetical protein